MVRVQLMGQLLKKELKESFSSPLVYILTALFSLLMGWLFFNYLVISKEMSSKDVFSSVYVPIFGNMNLVFFFFIPLLTMRSFAEEKKRGTLSLLLLSKLGHLEIILAKISQTLITSIFMLSFSVIFPIILSMSGYSNWPVVISTYVGMILSILCYTSVGVFCSSLTDNQVVAAFLSFCIIFGLMLLVLAANASQNHLMGQLLSYFSITFHNNSFITGAFKSYNFVFFASFTGVFVYLTDLVLESRNW